MMVGATARRFIQKGFSKAAQSWLILVPPWRGDVSLVWRCIEACIPDIWSLIPL